MSEQMDFQESALRDASTHLSKHVIREEPVRSFRFYCPYINKKVEKSRVDHRPGFVTFLAPVEKGSFSYSSTYCFTLTWTPGHMTIVGDLGELVVVHYHAMPTLEAACAWMQSSDFHYLLSKTKEERQFQRDATIADLWHTISEEAQRAVKEIDEETADYEKDKPKWRKRDGMTKVDFEQEMRYWEGDHPRQRNAFTEVGAPRHLENRNLWRQSEKDGWQVPDGFYWAFRAWKELKDECFSLDSDPNTLLTAEGLDDLKDALERRLYDLAEDEILGWVYRDLGLDDYSGMREYRRQAFFQIAALQHGCRMILEGISQEMAVAA
jgi:hypothetical protein